MPTIRRGLFTLFFLIPIGFVFEWQDIRNDNVARAEDVTAETNDVTSRIVTWQNGDVCLVQEIMIDAPVKKVWDAYTTAEGWQAWVAPHAELDLKIGGLIRTNYRPDATLEDDDTNTLHIVNYVPERVLTLQAVVSKNWPAILQEQEKQLYNIIIFEISGNKTKLVSYGVGYKDTPEFQKLLKFFVPANEETLKKLVAYVEQGKRAFEVR